MNALSFLQHSNDSVIQAKDSKQGLHSQLSTHSSQGPRYHEKHEMISLLFASMFLPFVIPKNGESATVGSKRNPNIPPKAPFIHVLRPDPDFVGPTMFFPTKPSSTFMGSFLSTWQGCEDQGYDRKKCLEFVVLEP